MGGIPGLVYRSIDAGYAVAGAGVQAALNAVTPAAGDRAASTPERETMLAVLNGVWGDHLEASGNPLAIPMSLKMAGVAFDARCPPDPAGASGPWQAAARIGARPLHERPGVAARGSRPR